MKTRFFISLLLVLTVISAHSQVNYQDVAVIINQNDPGSVEIGEYFAQQRNVPEANLLYIECPAVELIDSAGFMAIRQQLEEQMQERGLFDKVNYLVTTKGIPFNVRKGEDCTGINGVRFCSSLDSELSLLFSQWSGDILDENFVNNPYYSQYKYFKRSETGIYLVTRLDGYTVQDVKALIDRSGPGREVSKNAAQVIIDFSYVNDPTTKDLFTEFVQPAVNFLTVNDWEVVFDPDDELLTGREDVIAYYSINYQPSNKELNFEWLPGSLSEIFLSTGNLTFIEEQNYFDELSVPDLIREGAGSGCTYVNGAYFSMVVQLKELYERYLDEDMFPSFNLAESYYMAMPTLSNQFILVGDPKTSLAIQQNNVPDKGLPHKMVLFPNPATDRVNILFAADAPGEYRLIISDLAGKDLISKNIHPDGKTAEASADISSLPAGLYLVSISGPGHFFRTGKMLVTARR